MERERMLSRGERAAERATEWMSVNTRTCQTFSGQSRTDENLWGFAECMKRESSALRVTLYQQQNHDDLQRSWCTRSSLLKPPPLLASFHRKRSGTMTPNVSEGTGRKLLTLR